MEIDSGSESSWGPFSDEDDAGSWSPLPPFPVPDYGEVFKKFNFLKRELYEANNEICERLQKISELTGRVKELKKELNNERGKVDQVIPNGKREGALSEKVYNQNSLHEEIWRLLFFGFFPDGSDLLNLCRTCVRFHDILHPSKKLWLFNKVFPLISSWINNKDILNLRFVCKNWRRTIDSFIENHPKNQLSLRKGFDLQSPEYQLDFMRHLERTYRFGNLGSDIEMSHFMDLMKPSKNPFIGRSITIFEILYENDTNGEQDKYWKELFRFLQTYGKDIWNIRCEFSIHPRYSGYGYHRIYELLSHELFQLVPNLKMLEVSGYISNSYGPIHVKLMPPAPKLKWLKISPSGIHVRSRNDPAVSPIFRALFKKYHNQIVRLDLDSFQTLRLASKLVWPCLKELHLNKCGADMDKNLLKFSDYLKSFPGMERLGIGLGHGAPDEEEFHQLLVVLNRLSRSLMNFCSLNLTFHEAPDRRDIRLLPKGLFAPQCVHTLEFEEAMMDYSFLVKFPSLKTLNIISWPIGLGPISNDDREEIVEIRKYAIGGRMYESNLWQILPNLENLMFRTKLYTRKGYKAFLKGT